MSAASIFDGGREETRRILHDGHPTWVRRDGDELVLGDGRRVTAADAVHLPPCDPTKILCVHLNYPSRRIEFGAPEQSSPTYFQKPTTALNAHGGQVARPADCQYLNYEGELAVVVGRVMKGIARADVWSYLAGFTVANDVGAHDYRDTDQGGMLRVKGMDGFCPLGPGLVRGIDPRRADIRTILNGEVVQRGNLGELDFGIDYLLADLCRHITLLPGDVVLTGTPANSRPMQVGDVVVVEIDGIGRLENRIVERPAPREKIGHQPTDSDAVRRIALGQRR